MNKRYSAIYADPPWNFKTFSDKGRGRCPDAHYDVMSIDEIKKLPVIDMAADDCCLFLWATDPLLLQAIDLMRAWSFSYKTVAFCWAKLNKKADRDTFDESSFFTGLGYWTRANTELCLLGTRGSPKRRMRDVKRLVIAPRREHSRKPDEVYERIERLVDGPYLELFARTTRPRWEAWGNQVGLFDGGPVPTRRRPSVSRKAPDMPGISA